ncbi:Hsh49p [Sugiyamaella lignohabitans]|uniref:Hsh49p n=1 Tax=Sugiyamaella lignohabitans TaxID=796027 RepID=A0A167C5R8_9ASCO|nr:Hsh49p [Sugiyamaella lignohabitans]ANB11253.1 Hsh49p [Sugiyamaella lignohabitans]
MSNRLARAGERNPALTVYVGNLHEEVDEELLYELGIQAGPVVNVHIPLDRVNGKNSGFGFLEYRSEKDVDYAAQILNGIMLFGQPLRVNKSQQEKANSIDVGAQVFVGSLDPLVDEKTLSDTFSVFGRLIRPATIMRDENGRSRGFGFISFADFESSDRAIESMNDQYLMNRKVQLNYAFKKDGKGERHGDEAERLLAAEAKKHNYSLTLGEGGVSSPGNSSIPKGPRASHSSRDDGPESDSDGDVLNDLSQSKKPRNRGRKRQPRTKHRDDLSGANAIPTGPKRG